MKQLTCEMCGSTELLKQDGVFICQTCGCKYSVEEAKKLMIEGTVDVSGSTVRVDNSSYIQKSLENARRAKAKEDWEECEKYYNMVEQYEPNNIEAIFYSSYGKAKMAMVESDKYKRGQKVNVLKNSISVIDDNYDNSPAKYEENKKMIEQIHSDLMKLVNGGFVYNTTTSNNVTTNDSEYTYDMFINLCLGWIESLQNIIKVISEPKKTVYLWKLIREAYAYVYSKYVNRKYLGSFAEKYKEKVIQTDAIITKLDPSYQPRELPKQGCYVATCVYGSYDCPQVWTLRRYRDYTLAKTWYGRAFIHTYYAISPTIIKLLGNTDWFKKMWKSKLDRMVDDLQHKGVKDTPYQDRRW